MQDLDPRSFDLSRYGSNTGGRLCKHCHGIFMQRTVYHALASRAGLKYQRKRSDMLHSALYGCPLCRELLSIPPEESPKIYHTSTRRIEASEDCNRGLSKRSMSSLVDEFKYAKIFEQYTDPELRFVFKGDPSQRHYIKVSRYQLFKFREKWAFEIAASANDPAAEVVSHRAINRDVDCEQAYGKIREWLTTCDFEHTACHTHNIYPHRTRPGLVLDVSPAATLLDYIKLRRVEDQAVSYAALSYCWGTNQPNATTKSNLDEYLDRITLSSLPQSLRDAVTVTRKLGIRYLWVDSLCIIQDSEEDKTHEIARMEAIYSQAYVTISASSASNCNEGFLAIRGDAKTSINVPFRVGDHETGSVHLSTITDPKAKDYTLPSEPIHDRAWTFQESFMSRRMLIYSKYQLFWVCGKAWGRDGGRVTREDYFPNELSSRSLRSPKYSDWLLIAEEYSSRILTDPSDKLPALSSIAGYFEKHMKDKYLAGIWEKDLSQQLCWYYDKSKSDAPSLARPPCWRAPSWSFMSVEGSIVFNRSSLSFERGGPKFKVLSCESLPFSEQAPFGRVKAGKIKIRGQLLEIQNRLHSAASARYIGTDFGLPMMVSYRKGHIRAGNLHFDTAEISQNKQSKLVVHSSHGILRQASQLWCLLLRIEKHIVHPKPRGGSRGVGAESYCEFRPWGLILARLPNEDFHRVGYFEGIHDAASYFSRRSQEIKIV